MDFVVQIANFQQKFWVEQIFIIIIIIIIIISSSSSSSSSSLCLSLSYVIISSVSIVTRLGAGQPKNLVRFLARSRDFSFSAKSADWCRGPPRCILNS
jgi:hypothetical protein